MGGQVPCLLQPLSWPPCRGRVKQAGGSVRSSASCPSRGSCTVRRLLRARHQGQLLTYREGRSCQRFCWLRRGSHLPCQDAVGERAQGPAQVTQPVRQSWDGRPGLRGLQGCICVGRAQAACHSSCRTAPGKQGIVSKCESCLCHTGAV